MRSAKDIYQNSDVELWLIATERKGEWSGPLSLLAEYTLRYKNVPLPNEIEQDKLQFLYQKSLAGCVRISSNPDDSTIIHYHVNKKAFTRWCLRNANRFCWPAKSIGRDKLRKLVGIMIAEEEFGRGVLN